MTRAYTSRVAEAITEWWGERCDDHMTGCACCDAWAEYNSLVAARREALQEARLEEIDERITCEELVEVFGERIPLEYAVMLAAGAFVSPLSARRAINRALDETGASGSTDVNKTAFR